MLPSSLAKAAVQHKDDDPAAGVTLDALHGDRRDRPPYCGYPARATSPERGDLDFPITRTVAWSRLRGLGVTTICTSLSSAFKQRIRRSMENPSSLPASSSETLG